MITQVECPFCKSAASCENQNQKFFGMYTCPVCGRFELIQSDLLINEDNKVASFLYYNRFQNTLSGETDYRYHTTRNKEQCDLFRNYFKEGDLSRGHPVHMSSEIIQTWYPRTFSERVDYIIQKIESISHHIGQGVSISSNQEVFSLLFVDRKESSNNHSQSSAIQWRDERDCVKEAQYMIDYLKETSLLKANSHLSSSRGVHFTLTPMGYSRVDELQKNETNGRTVFIAMKFGDDTKDLREAIRKGVADAGFNAIYIDEVQHNNLITPELLKHIRDSKFVIVDLTHKNNGAYFEEGYAMGLGKQVIQLCKKDTQLHFDIAQKNTIMWQTESDIPEQLYNRIKATID